MAAPEQASSPLRFRSRRPGNQSVKAAHHSWAGGRGQVGGALQQHWAFGEGQDISYMKTQIYHGLCNVT